jgi:hypothetical protein
MKRFVRIPGVHRPVVGREQHQGEVHQQQGQSKGKEDLRHVAEPQNSADQEMLQEHADDEQDRHRDGKRHQGVYSEVGGKEEADVHADHHELALGEVHDFHDAENQRNADAHKRVDSADEQAVHDGLCQCLQHWSFDGA